MDLSKIPPWAWAVGAVGVGAGLYLYKKHGEAAKKELESESSIEKEPVIAGVEPEEYPYSIAGATGGGAAGALGNAGESQQEFRELFGQLGEFEKGFSTQEAEYNRSILEAIKAGQPTAGGTTTTTEGSGGGAPHEEAKGTTPAPPPPTAAPKCPAGFPHQNGPTAGPHTCYKDITCGNGCQGHKYQDGHADCQTKSGGKCHW
jgi:hypothetical protein